MHVAQRLLARGDHVVGIDNLNDYYDVDLKQARLEQLRRPGFEFEKLDVADGPAIEGLFARHRFDRVVHLAAQAGVRYSLINPHEYVRSNITGFLNILEACRHHPVAHLVYASSSSVYGGNTRLPFAESDNVDHPVSLYAATQEVERADGAHLQPPVRHPDHRAALLHRLRPVGPAGHGAVPVHQGDPRGTTRRRVQPRPDAARLHLHRRHRRRRGARARPGAGRPTRRSTRTSRTRRTRGRRTRC